jgi:hypothetical protein
VVQLAASAGDQACAAGRQRGRPAHGGAGGLRPTQEEAKPKDEEEASETEKVGRRQGRLNQVKLPLVTAAFAATLLTGSGGQVGGRYKAAKLYL